MSTQENVNSTDNSYLPVCDVIKTCVHLDHSPVTGQQGSKTVTVLKLMLRETTQIELLGVVHFVLQRLPFFR